jgi:hypothetical protein
MSDLNELKSLIERLPKTDAYGAARQVGSVFLHVLEEAEGQRGQRWVPYVDPSALEAEDRGNSWQRLGDASRRVVAGLQRMGE